MRTALHNAFLIDVDNLPEFEITLVSKAGVSLVIPDTRLGAGSLSFKSSNGDGAYMCGGASISQCSFSVLTFDDNTYADFDYSDAKVYIDIVINNIESHYWAGYVTECNQSYNTLTIACYDFLGKADECIISNLGISFPTTRSTLVSAIRNKIGFQNGSGSISSTAIQEMDGSTTLRQALAYIGEAEGVSWYQTYDAALGICLEARAIDWTTMYQPVDVFGRSLTQYQVSYDCVDVTSYDGTVSEAVGSFGDVTKVVSGNPCVDNSSFYTDLATIKSVYLDDDNVGRKFLAGTLTILSDPGVECGDIFNINHNGHIYNFVVGSINFKGSVTMTLGMTTPTSDTADKRQSYATKSAEQTISDELDNPDSKLSKAISEGGGGGSSSLVSMYGPLWYGTSSSTLLSVSDVTDKDGNTPQFIMLLDGGESSRLYYVKKMVISPIYCLDSTSLGVSTDKTYNVRTKLTRVIAMATCYCSYQPDEELPAIPPQTRITLELNIRSYMPDSELATSGYLDIERISLTPELGVHSRYDGLLVNWTNPTVLANDSQQQMIGTGTFRLNDGVTMRMQYKKIT